jgi:hypothetical protein
MAILSFSAEAVPPDPVIHLTFGRSKSEFRWSDRRELTFESLAKVLSKAETGPKDGTCYTPATFTGFARRMDQAAQIDIVVLDADCGHTLEEIEKAVKARGWQAIIHSTYSHLSDVTTIAAEAFDRWSAANDGADVGAFMLAKKGYLPRVLKGAHIVEEMRDGSSRNYIVNHQVCPKFRIILPLETPWVASEYDSQSLANASWKERIGALSSALNLFHDQSCVDTSRLFYLPRTREGREFTSQIVLGEPCPLWDLPEANSDPAALPLMQIAIGSRPQLVSPDHKFAHDANGEVINLTTWAAKYAGRFEVTKAIKALAPNLIGSRRSGPKQHIECPNGADHVTGGTDRTGTYIVNASEVAHAGLPSINSGFVIHCMHNGCAGRDRLDHVSALLNGGKLTCSDLISEDFLTPEVPPVDPSAIIKSAAKGHLKPPPKQESQGNIDPILYADLPGALGIMHSWICETAPKPQPALTLGAVLAFAASVIGQRVQLQGSGVRPNIYVLAIGHSGAGKERPRAAIKQMARAAGLFNDLIGVEEVASDAGIIASVVMRPRQVMLLDEVSALLQSANAKGVGSHLSNVPPVLLKLYSSSNSTYQTKSYVDTEKVKLIDQPCVSLLGNCTPIGLSSALTTKDITSGLLSRMVLFDAGDLDPRYQSPKMSEPPQEALDWIIAWSRVSPVQSPLHRVGGEQLLEPRTVFVTPDAEKVALDFEGEMHSAKLRARVRGTDAVYVRAHENALKFALIRACAALPVKVDGAPSIDEATLCVDANIMRWAVSLSRATVIRMDAAACEISDTPFQQNLRAIERVLKSAGERGLTSREMARLPAGRHPKNYLEDLLTVLSKAHTVFWVEKMTAGMRGRPRSAYVHQDFIVVHYPQMEAEDDANNS